MLITSFNWHKLKHALSSWWQTVCDSCSTFHNLPSLLSTLEAAKIQMNKCTATPVRPCVQKDTEKIPKLMPKCIKIRNFNLKGSSKVNIPTFPNKPNHVTRVGYKAAVCDRQCGMLNWGGSGASRGYQTVLLLEEGCSRRQAAGCWTSSRPPQRPGRWDPRRSALSLSFINLTACAKNGSMKVNQTGADTLPAVACEAHPKIGSFSRRSITLRAPVITLSWLQSSATTTTWNVIYALPDSCGRALDVSQAGSTTTWRWFKHQMDPESA